MFIQKIILFKYKCFLASNIKRIEIDITNNAQVIIGSIGSGKSSLLHMLFPQPHEKSLFDKDGYCILHLEHDNSEYRLEYYVNHRQHFFYKDDVNLNIGKTYDIQTDLIAEHLRVYPNIHSILNCSFNISEIIPSARKKILMNINPINISLFLEKFKYVHTNVIAMGNNLQMLHTRAKQLMARKIPKEQFDELCSQRDNLIEKEKLLFTLITLVNNELSRLEDVDYNFNENYFRQIINEINTHLPTYSVIDGLSYIDDNTNLKIQQATQNQQLNYINTQIEDLIKRINKNETLISEFKVIDKEIFEELSLLEENINKFNFKDNFTPVRDIEQCRSILSVIDEIIYRNSHLEKLNPSANEYINLLETEINTCISKLRNNNKEIERLTLLYSDSVKSIQSFNIPSDCSSDNCELLLNYVNSQEKIREQNRSLNTHIVELRSQQEELSEQLEELKIKLEQQRATMNLVKTVNDILSNSSLSLFTSNEVHSFFTISIYEISNVLKRLIEDSILYIDYQRIKNRISEIRILINKEELQRNFNITSLKQSIDEDTDKLSDLRIISLTTSRRQHQITKNLQRYSNYIKDINKCRELSQQLDELKQQSTIYYTKQYYRDISDALNKIQSETKNKLFEITRICKEQELLLARLDSEIEASINTIEPKYNKAKEIEKSLFRLPIKYTTDFIQSLINITNKLLSSVASYPIKLKDINSKEEFNFSFPVCINDELDNVVEVKDISDCSTGQKKLIQILFNLAIIIKLKYDQYPIFCDEYNNGLDANHHQQMTDLLLNLKQDAVISQLFLTNHDSSMVEQLSHTSDIIVINPDNIITPTVFNEHVKIEYYN